MTTLPAPDSTACHLVVTHPGHGAEMELDQLLTPQALAAYLDVPVKTLYAWRYRREGPPSFRVGRHLRYRRSDVEEWISGRLEDSATDLRVVRPRG
jgi:excisionase family DNA binding protein